MSARATMLGTTMLATLLGGAIVAASAMAQAVDGLDNSVRKPAPLLDWSPSGQSIKPAANYGQIAQSPPPSSSLPSLAAQPVVATGSSNPNINAAISSMLQQQEALIKLLSDKGILSADQAKGMMDTAHHNAALAAQPATPASAIPSTNNAGTINVPYIPETVKRQIKDQLKSEVLAQVKAEGWAAPDALPEWTKRIKIFGDFRLRYEGDFFNKNNNPLAAIDYNTINNGNPLDVNIGTSTQRFYPLLNVTRNRDRIRERARIGLLADIDDDFSVEAQITTGSNATPVSTNQTLGPGFNRYTVTLNEFALIYHPDPGFSIVAGRMVNPFVKTNLVWADDLNLDGVVAHYSHDLPLSEILPIDENSLSGFLTLGAFPLQFTDLNLSTNALSTIAGSSDKWLAAVQGGFDWKIDPLHSLKFATAYYDYLNYQGNYSSFCTTTAQTDPCSTDFSRPPFYQPGNTVFPIRQVVDATALAAGTPSTGPIYEYFGLASPFRILDVNFHVDIADLDPTHIVLDFDYARNLAYNKDNIINKSTAQGNGGPYNNYNLKLLPAPQTLADYTSGPNAYNVRLQVGDLKIQEYLDWNVFGGYKYVDPDSVVSAYTDSDYLGYGAGGGTNAKGYYLGGNLGLAHNVWTNVRWFDFNEALGDGPRSTNVLQVDVNAKF